jgi:hypothetical protein
VSTRANDGRIGIGIGLGESQLDLWIREGVAIVPAEATTVDRSSSTFVRLPLALDDDVIEVGVERLARAFRRFRPETPRPRLMV